MLEQKFLHSRKLHYRRKSLFLSGMNVNKPRTTCRHFKHLGRRKNVNNSVKAEQQVYTEKFLTGRKQKILYVILV